MSNYQFSLKPQKVPLVKTKYRLIQTKIPAPGTAKLLRRLQKVESRSMHGQLPIIWNKAINFNVFDLSGNKWIDFTSTIFVANVGHSNKKVTESIKKTLDSPLYSCYAYANPLRAKFLEKLIDFTGNKFDKAFLLSSGTEATEAVLKLIRMHGSKNMKRRRGVICIENNWHGRTLGAQMMSSNLAQSEWIGYKDIDIHHIAFPYPWALNDLSGKDFLIKEIEKLEKRGISLEKDICGFMLETFQGWGAVFYPKDFVQEIERFCKDNNILLAFDEMQSGFARTGKAFGFEHYDVSPSLIACGKGMGGGVPLSAVIGKGEIMDLPEIGNMSSTHSANPLVCSAGLAVINEINSKKLISAAKQKGEIFFQRLENLKEKFPKHISYILGKGMIYGVIFVEPGSGLPASGFASKVAEKCMQKGLLVVHTGRESIKLGPPLTIDIDALIEGVDVMEEAIEEVINYEAIS